MSLPLPSPDPTQLNLVPHGPAWVAPGWEKLPAYIRRRLAGNVHDGCTRYTARLYIARPPWFERRRVQEVYAAAARLRKRGVDCVVDHIVPFNSPLVCGLHCLDNLRIVSRRGNSVKSNHAWPGHPVVSEQMGLL